MKTCSERAWQDPGQQIIQHFKHQYADEKYILDLDFIPH